jgi:hypothetical protein
MEKVSLRNPEVITLKTMAYRTTTTVLVKCSHRFTAVAHFAILNTLIIK